MCSSILQKRLYASYITRKNYYELIGVAANATQIEIRDAFLKRSKELHPDLSQKSKDTRVGWSSKTSNTEQFMLVKEAYDVLRNVEKRREYDMANSREGGFLMEATVKTQQMSSKQRNAQRAEWSADVIPDRKKATSTVYSHFRNPEEEFLREKQKNRMLVVIGATIFALIGANILCIQKLQSDKLLEDSKPVIQ